MASGMALPVDVRDLMRSGTQLVSDREKPVHLAVLIEVDSPDTLIDAVRWALRPSTAMATLQVDIAEPGKTPTLSARPDAVVAVGGSGTQGLDGALRVARAAGVPVVVVALGDDARAASLSDALLQPVSDLVVRMEPGEAMEGLGHWLVDSLGSKRLALAHNFAFIRRLVAEDAVKTTALQNALVGGVAVIPGADMPIMTANQAKMILQIAAAYGQPIGVDRAKELAAVVGGAFVLRTVARQVLTAVPVLGWAIKGGIGYAGTLAMGKAAIEYFEEGGDIGGVAHRFKDMGRKASERLPRRKPVEAPDEGQLALPVANDEGAGA